MGQGDLTKQETLPFEIFSYEGLSNVTGAPSPAEFVFLNVNGQNYVIITVNVVHLDLVTYVTNIVNGGDFTEGPNGFITVNTM